MWQQGVSLSLFLDFVLHNVFNVFSSAMRCQISFLQISAYRPHILFRVWSWSSTNKSLGCIRTTLQEHLGEWPGPVIEEETNEVVSMHSGFWFYTIGQRSGLDLGHLPNGPWCACHQRCCVNNHPDGLYLAFHMGGL